MFLELKSIKALMSISLAGVLMLAMCSCTSQDTQKISLYDLNKAMSEVADFKDMKYTSSGEDDAEDLFKNISDMDYSKVDGFFINYAANGTGNADEIACIKVKSRSDVTEAVASLNAHLQRRISLYEAYDKSQSEKLSRAVVTSYGTVAVLIVGDNSSKMEKAFNDFFGDK